MSYINLKCNECDEINDIFCDGHNPLFCPSCRTVDNFSETDETEPEYCRACNKRIEATNKDGVCSKKCKQEMVAEHSHHDKY